MKAMFALVTITFLATGVVNAAEEFLGFWASSPKEVLNITKDGDAYHALFTRENVKNEFEKVGFPAAIEDGGLIITGEQGCLLYTSPSPRDLSTSRMPSSA